MDGRQYPTAPLAGQTPEPVRVTAPARALIALLVLALGGCAQLPKRPELPVEVAVPEGSGSPLDAWIAASEQAHAGQSAFRLLSKGSESFVTRVKSANAATRSIDVQTYIWHGDTTGMHLAERLLAAADRGCEGAAAGG